jgi:hypothetical protein
VTGGAAAPSWHFGLRIAAALALVAALPGCALSSQAPGRGPAVTQAPERFTIVPDDYHVPYAGTAGDGRKFFLSDELFASDGDGSAYVGLFLWNADGTYDDVKVDIATRPAGLPDGQAGSAAAQDLVDARLEELGDYVLEPIEVEPFTATVNGVTFGWKVGQYDDGTYYINISPGDFISYYEPFDGLEYDT